MRKNITVIARMQDDGKVIPLTILWNNEKSFEIDKVLDIRKKRVDVRCGSIRLTVKPDDLYLVTAKKEQKQRVQFVRKVAVPKTVQLEINLLGKTVSEAIIEVDAFIDQAVLSGLEEVKIIHGIGTGKLKEGIRNHLRKHKNVSDFRSGV